MIRKIEKIDFAEKDVGIFVGLVDDLLFVLRNYPEDKICHEMHTRLINMFLSSHVTYSPPIPTLADETTNVVLFSKSSILDPRH